MKSLFPAKRLEQIFRKFPGVVVKRGENIEGEFIVTDKEQIERIKDGKARLCSKREGPTFCSWVCDRPCDERDAMVKDALEGRR